MPAPLCVLILEDRPSDVELILHELRRAGFEPDWQHVVTKSDYLAHLHVGLDVILADYTLPQFDALHALHLLQESGLDIPFIVITGSISEEVAVECMRQGAADYLLKDRLARLGLAVTQALQAKKARDEKRQAEAARRESEARYRSLFEDSPISLWEEDFSAVKMHIDSLRSQGIKDFSACFENHPEVVAQCAAMVRVVDVNKATLEMYKARSKEEFREGLGTVLGEESYDAFKEELIAVAEGRTRLEIEDTNRTLTGDERRIALRWSVAPGYEGTLSKVFVSIVDITERERAEEEIRRLNQFLEIVIDSANVWLDVLDEKADVLIWNKAAEAISGYSREEVVGHGKIWEWLYPDEKYRKEITDKAAEIIQKGEVVEDFETIIRTKSGENRIISWHSRNLVSEKGAPIGSVALGRDITERKRAEEEIRRRNRELAMLNQIIAASATDLEPKSILETTCRELARAFDLPQAAAALLNEDKTRAVVVAEYRAEGRPAALHGTIPVVGNPSFQYLLSHKAPLVVDDAQNDPRLAPVHDLMRQRGTVSLLLLPLIIGGEVVGSLGLDAMQARRFSSEEVSLAWSVADQVAGALARAWLSAERQRLSTVIEQTAESVIITDTQGTILYVNPAFERVSGYSRAEVIGRTPRILKSGKQDAAFYQGLWAIISARQVWHGRFVNKKKDGTLYTEDAIITPVRDEGGTIVSYVAVQRDVTRELQLEEQSRQSQKMEAIGRLAGGVAHDFNNLLTAIKGYTQLVLLEMSPDDPYYYDLTQISQTADRATILIRQLLTFSRRETTRPVVLNLNTVITDLFKLLGRVIGEDVELITHLAPNLANVQADAGQMEQVLMNLAVNARDAMPTGGRLAIETANVTLGERYADASLEMQPGEYVLLTISDTGVGMDAEVLDRIFEPFFTTKTEGTGLGLATVYGIVGQHKGHIHVYSEPGHGTTFRIYIPAYRPQPGEQLEESARQRVRPADQLTGNETLLLVEDETSVRELVQRALEGYGYTVLAAADARQAADLFRANRDDIVLLISDVIMPGATGPALYQMLSSEAPHLKVLFLSGYTGDMVHERGVLRSVPFLQKPFTPTELAHKVREVLDAPQ